jgi:REP element-mobilizing transposase RayT
VARNAGCECHRIGGMPDHVHLAIELSRTITIADLVKTLKTSSSKWIKHKQPDLKAFAWQRGYGVFSVGPTDKETLVEYIENQDMHHKKRNFQDEYLAFLKKYNIEYDERYVWD